MICWRIGFLHVPRLIYSVHMIEQDFSHMAFGQLGCPSLSLPMVGPPLLSFLLVR